MDAETRRRVEANLFPAAHAAIESWDTFPWHLDRKGRCDTWVEHSSQALAIDVFGTLKCHPARDVILDALASAWGFPVGGEWRIELEHVLTGTLGEPTPTQVDAVASSNKALIYFECKFTESGGGPCSQPQPIPGGAHKGIVQCNGNYEMQTNHAIGHRGRCALSSKGITYWEHIPRVFFIEPQIDHAPCPFAGSRYQWMRNLVGCWVESQKRGVRPAFVIVYADLAGFPTLPVAAELASNDWSDFRKLLRPDGVRLVEASYSQLISDASVGARPDGVLAELATWVDGKIRRVALSGSTGKERLTSA